MITLGYDTDDRYKSVFKWEDDILSQILHDKKIYTRSPDKDFLNIDVTKFLHQDVVKYLSQFKDKPFLQFEYKNIDDTRDLLILCFKKDKLYGFKVCNQLNNLDFEKSYILKNVWRRTKLDYKWNWYVTGN